MPTTLTCQTREETLARLARSHEARKLALSAPVRDEFLASPDWQQLAREAGVRLPMRGQRVTRGKLIAWLKKIEVPVSGYLAWTGSRNLNHALELVGNWGLRPYAGVLLEHRDQMRRFAAEDADRRRKGREQGKS